MDKVYCCSAGEKAATTLPYSPTPSSLKVFGIAGSCSANREACYFIGFAGRNLGEKSWRSLRWHGHELPQLYLHVCAGVWDVCHSKSFSIQCRTRPSGLYTHHITAHVTHNFLLPFCQPFSWQPNEAKTRVISRSSMGNLPCLLVASLDNCIKRKSHPSNMSTDWN